MPVAFLWHTDYLDSQVRTEPREGSLPWKPGTSLDHNSHDDLKNFLFGGRSLIQELPAAPNSVAQSLSPILDCRSRPLLWYPQGSGENRVVKVLQVIQASNTDSNAAANIPKQIRFLLLPFSAIVFSYSCPRVGRAHAPSLLKVLLKVKAGAECAGLPPCGVQGSKSHGEIIHMPRAKY